MGGGIFVVVALTPYGGWFEEAKEWMGRVADSQIYLHNHLYYDTFLDQGSRFERY